MENLMGVLLFFWLQAEAGVDHDNHLRINKCHVNVMDGGCHVAEEFHFEAYQIAETGGHYAGIVVAVAYVIVVLSWSWSMEVVMWGADGCHVMAGLHHVMIFV